MSQRGRERKRAVFLKHGLARTGAAAVLAGLALAHAGDSAPGTHPLACVTAATWFAPAGAKPRAMSHAAVLDSMVAREIVLLGETHDDADHHHWQLHTLAALHARRPITALGFEAFPRRAQPVLDRWVQGELTNREFLQEVHWEKVWNFPFELYLPLFEFARLHRIPMVALNVDRSLTEAVAATGWDAVPPERREGVSRPAPASREYHDFLFGVFSEHAHSPGAKPARRDPRFQRFVEAQTTWDRAMAEALASRVRGSQSGGRALVVGIVGAGHVRGGFGVPHQLRALGFPNVGTLLPVSSEVDCSELKQNLADAVFVLPQRRRAAPAPPRLGARLELRDGAVVIDSVDAGSLAEQSGIRAGDRVLTIAGVAAGTVGMVVSAVRNQPAGTWLPLHVRRGDQTLELIVKFPPST